MKTTSRFLFVLFFFFSLSAINAQGLLDVNGLSAISVHPDGKTIRARGFSVGFYTPPINLIKINPAFSAYAHPQSVLNLRFGLNFSPAWMGKEKLTNVPLKLPETGTASVKFSNHFFSLDASMRISVSLFNDAFHPYIEASAGYRQIKSKLDIYPNDKSKTTDTAIANVRGGATGLALGFCWAFTDNRNVMLNASVGWNHCNVNGKFVDLQSLHRKDDFIGYDFHSPVPDFVLVKVGLSFLLVYDADKARKYSENHPSTGHHSGHASSNGHSHVSTGHCSGHGR